MRCQKARDARALARDAIASELAQVGLVSHARVQQWRRREDRTTVVQPWSRIPTAAKNRQTGARLLRLPSADEMKMNQRTTKVRRIRRRASRLSARSARSTVQAREIRGAPFAMPGRTC